VSATRRASAHNRILDAADGLFTEHGIRAVGVEAVVAAADTAKTTLYAHFGSKDGLVAAYLQRRAHQRQERLEQGLAAHGGLPTEKILHLYDLLAVELAEPGYRGSPFANACVELGADHPAAAVAHEHRQWLLDTFTDLTAATAAPDPAAIAAQLLLLHEAAGQAAGDAARTARAVGEALLAAQLTAPARTAADPTGLPALPPLSLPANGRPEAHEPAPAARAAPSLPAGGPHAHRPAQALRAAEHRQPQQLAPAARHPVGDSPEPHRTAPAIHVAGGSVAGGSREAHRLVAFLNSAHLPDGDDQLADERAGPWLEQWLAEAGARAPAGLDHRTPPPTDLLMLREGLRQLAAVNCGAEAEAAVVAEAEAVLRRVPLLVDLAAGGEPRLAPTSATPERLAAAVAAAAYLAVRARGEWPRLKVCGSPDCRWAFVDGTRNRSRRWCDMAGCGNRAKNRAWRRRQNPVTVKMV
jgi:predicted RNA-binding Zn ribbon-like protein/AcrR family transcriptional regulator